MQAGNPTKRKPPARYRACSSVDDSFRMPRHRFVYCVTSSTRRLRPRPSSEVFEATGAYGPIAIGLEPVGCHVILRDEHLDDGRSTAAREVHVRGQAAHVIGVAHHIDLELGVLL